MRPETLASAAIVSVGLSLLVEKLLKEVALDDVIVHFVAKLRLPLAPKLRISCAIPHLLQLMFDIFFLLLVSHLFLHVQPNRRNFADVQFFEGFAGECLVL